MILKTFFESRKHFYPPLGVKKTEVWTLTSRYGEVRKAVGVTDFTPGGMKRQILDYVPRLPRLLLEIGRFIYLFIYFWLGY